MSKDPLEPTPTAPKEGEEKCECEKGSCLEDCKRNHTHKRFFCEVCEPVVSVKKCYACTHPESKTMACQCPKPHDYVKPHFRGTQCKDKCLICTTHPTSEKGEWEEEFDKQFVSVARGCTVESPAELKSFIRSTLAAQKAELLQGLVEKLEGMMNDYDEGETQGARNALRDTIELIQAALTPKED